MKFVKIEVNTENVSTKRVSNKKKWTYLIMYNISTLLIISEPIGCFSVQFYQCIKMTLFFCPLKYNQSSLSLTIEKILKRKNLFFGPSGKLQCLWLIVYEPSVNNGTLL